MCTTPGAGSSYAFVSFTAGDSGVVPRPLSSAAAALCTARGRAGGRQAPLTCLGRRVLLAPLEGVPEEQLIAPAARAHQDHADGAGIVPHPAGARRAPEGNSRGEHRQWAEAESGRRALRDTEEAGASASALTLARLRRQAPRACPKGRLRRHDSLAVSKGACVPFKVIHLI